MTDDLNSAVEPLPQMRPLARWQRPGARWALIPTLAMAASCACAEGVQLYGLVDAFVGSTKLSGASKSTVGIDSGGMSTSFWGMGGTEDLGGGFKANFRLEGYFLADTGASGRYPGDTLLSRNAYAGLEGAFGEVRLGRLSNPFFLATVLIDPYNGSTKYSPFLDVLWIPGQGRYVAGDTNWDNAVGYYSPDFGGLSFRGVYGLGEAKGTNSSNNAVGMFLYDKAPFSATFAMQRTRVGPGFVTGAWAQTALVGGVSYDFRWFKVLAQYAHTSTSGTSTLTDSAQLGATVPAGTGKVILSAVSTRVRSDVVPNGRRLVISGGYDYPLSKRTDLYANVMFDKFTGLGSGTSVGAGIRHKF